MYYSCLGVDGGLIQLVAVHRKTISLGTGLIRFQKGSPGQDQPLIATAKCDLEAKVQMVKVWSVGESSHSRTKCAHVKQTKWYRSISNILVSVQLLLMVVMFISLRKSSSNSLGFVSMEGTIRLTSHVVNVLASAAGMPSSSMHKRVLGNGITQTHG